MTGRSRRSRSERARRRDREHGRQRRDERREARTGIATVDPHASWRDVYRALDAALSIEPDRDDDALTLTPNDE